MFYIGLVSQGGFMSDAIDSGWTTIVYAADLGDCPVCEEPFCTKHQLHYAECACIGPMETDGDDVETNAFGQVRRVIPSGCG